MLIKYQIKQYSVNSKLNNIDKLECILLAFVVMTNGIFNYFMGEIISEGLVLFLTLIFLVRKIYFKLLRKLIIPFLIIVLFIFSNLIIISYSNEWVRILFFYPYLFFLCILLSNSNSPKIYFNNYFLVVMFLVFSLMSSIYAIAQRYGVSTLLPLESELRATGLSRSSLNLTGCLLALFGMGVLVIKDSYKKFVILLIVFLGILAAGGRGGIISSLILLSLVYYRKMKDFFFISILVLISALIFLIIPDWFLRSFGALNFVSDQSNIDRFNSYLAFLDEYSFMGAGIGTTSPAVQRFKTATGFESGILNAVYEMGIPFGILFMLAILIWFKSLCRFSKKSISIFSLSLLPVLAGQQLYGIPSAFCAFIISVYVLAYSRKQIHL